MGWWRTALVALAWLTAVPKGIAQQPLHEFFDTSEVASGALPVTDSSEQGPPSVSPPSFGSSMGPADDGPVALDRDTTPPDALPYHDVFDPPLAPHKRVGVRDRVERLGDSWVLVREPPELEPLLATRLVGDERVIHQARFEVFPGAPQRMASSGPDMQLHELNVSPPAQVRFYRDQLGVVYAESDATVPVEVSVRVSADRGYFTEATLDDGPLAEGPSVPAGLRTEADTFLRQVGLEGVTGRALVEALTAYFRAFTTGPSPPGTRSAYLDIALGRRGVCRHRAHAFVLTLQARGIAARYVYNEAHAFAEVGLADGRWVRVDLGGAVGELLRDGEDSGEPSEGEGDEGTDGGPGEADAVTESLDDVLPPVAGEPGEAGGVALEPTRFVGLTAPVETYRTDTIRVRGALVTFAGEPVAGVRIAVFLGPSAHEAHPVIGIGALETDATGVFSGTVTVPADIEAGDWGVYTVFEGDGVHAPVRSD